MFLNSECAFRNGVFCKIKFYCKINAVHCAMAGVLIDRQEESRKRKVRASVEASQQKKIPKTDRAIVSLSYLAQDERRCTSFTGFPPAILTQFLAEFSTVLQPDSAYGAGRRSSQSADIRGIFVLNHFRNAPSLSTSSILFGLDRSTLDRILNSLIPRLLTEIRVMSFAFSYQHMSTPFEFFPDCFAAVDCTFVPHPHPPGLSFEQAKNYYSVKHGAYGYKWLAIVNSRGECLFVSDMFPAGTHDFAMCIHETVFPHVQRITGPNRILGDKGFVGLQNRVGAIIPIKRVLSRELSIDERELNLKIAKSRILVENFFGRLKVVWSLFAGNSNIHVQHLNDRFLLAVHLTNFHIRHMPLRNKSKEFDVVENEMLPDEFAASPNEITEEQ